MSGDDQPPAFFVSVSDPLGPAARARLDHLRWLGGGVALLEDPSRYAGPGAVVALADRLADAGAGATDPDAVWHVALTAPEAFEPSPIARTAIPAAWSRDRAPDVERDSDPGRNPRTDPWRPIALSEMVLAETRHTETLLTRAGVAAAFAPTPIAPRAAFAPSRERSNRASLDRRAPIWRREEPADPLAPGGLDAFSATRRGPLGLARIAPASDPIALWTLLRAASSLGPAQLIVALDLDDASDTPFDAVRAAYDLDAATPAGAQIGFVAETLDEAAFDALAGAASFVVAPTSEAGAADGLIWLARAILSGAVPIAPRCPPLEDRMIDAGAILTAAERVRARRNAVGDEARAWIAAPEALGDAFAAVSQRPTDALNEIAARARAHLADIVSYEAATAALFSALGIASQGRVR